MFDSTAPTLRQRIVASAIALTVESGWAHVTMGAVAASVGVSRQTVYHEVGSKPALAEAMVLAELEKFLAVVHRSFNGSPDDVVEGVRAAVRGVLELAENDALIAAIVSGAHGADQGLLPLLTTDAEPVIALARGALAERVSQYRLTVSGVELTRATDTIARAVLSHVMRPVGTADDTADDLAWVARRLLVS